MTEEPKEMQPITSGELGEQIAEEFGVAKSTYLKFRKELEDLGYDVTSQKVGKKGYYSPEQQSLIKHYCSLPVEQRADFPKAGTIQQQEEESDNLNYRQPQPSSPRTGKDRAIESWELAVAEKLIYQEYLEKTGNFSNDDLWQDVQTAKEKIHQHDLGKYQRPTQLADELLGKLK